MHRVAPMLAPLTEQVEAGKEDIVTISSGCSRVKGKVSWSFNKYLHTTCLKCSVLNEIIPRDKDWVKIRIRLWLQLLLTILFQWGWVNTSYCVLHPLHFMQLSSLWSTFHNLSSYPSFIQPSVSAILLSLVLRQFLTKQHCKNSTNQSSPQ